MTPLQIWLHPKRAVQALEEAQERLAAAESEAQEARAHSEKFAAEVTDLKKTRTRLQSENTETGAKLLHATQLLEIQQKDIDEIREMMKGVETMQSNYERRIARLKEKIADLQAALRREAAAAPAEELTPLPPITTAPITPAASHAAPRPPKPAPTADPDTGDWLLPLDL